MWITLILKLFISISIISNPAEKGLSVDPAKIDGLTFVAPPRPFSEKAFDDIIQSRADWISVVPFAYSMRGKNQLFFNTQRQWWGEKLEGVISTIKEAKAKKLKIMLKPQVYIPGSWIGEMRYDTEEEWSNWEKGYTAYIDTLLSIAEEHEVELFCIGTECKISIQERTGYWKNLISHARSKYSGQLTYSSNWDSYNQVPFWDELDFIGISAYFPLTDTKTPSIEELKRKWAPTKKRLKKYSKRNKKQILFTEFGYMSIDGCAYKAWEIEKQIYNRDINEQAQANALDALLSSFWDEKYWAGGFLWKWFPDMQGHEGYIPKDYTPQGKISEQIVNKWYKKNDN